MDVVADNLKGAFHSGHSYIAYGTDSVLSPWHSNWFHVNTSEFMTKRFYES